MISYVVRRSHWYIQLLPGLPTTEAASFFVFRVCVHLHARCKAIKHKVEASWIATSLWPWNGYSASCLIFRVYECNGENTRREKHPVVIGVI